MLYTGPIYEYVRTSFTQATFSKRKFFFIEYTLNERFFTKYFKHMFTYLNQYLATNQILIIAEKGGKSSKFCSIILEFVPLPPSCIL